MRVILTLVYISLTFVACNHSKNLTSTNKLKQGIAGFVKEVTGNQMPGPGRELPEPKGVRTIVFVYETTNVSQTDQVNGSPFYTAIRTRLIDSVHTDEKGFFSLSLVPGAYSLFTKVDGKYYSNNFDTKNNIAPVTVEANRVSE